MSAILDPALRRRCFFDPPGATPAEQAAARRMLTLLLVQDGSTTRLCEALAGGPVGVQVLSQCVTAEVPAVVRRMLPGGRLMERFSCLSAQGEVMSDNLAYIALDGIDPALLSGLEDGSTPIGHLLPRFWARRAPLDDAEVLHQRLWSRVGLPDAQATRSYCIESPEGPRMLITETFRRGMLSVGDST